MYNRYNSLGRDGKTYKALIAQPEGGIAPTRDRSYATGSPAYATGWGMLPTGDRNYVTGSSTCTTGEGIAPTGDRSNATGSPAYVTGRGIVSTGDVYGQKKRPIFRKASLKYFDY